MLDWFSDWRMKGEREDKSSPLFPGHCMPDYVLVQPDGHLLRLSTIRTKLVLLFLPEPITTAEAQLLVSLNQVSAEVRANQTQILVVTRPEYLSAVVALSGDLLIGADKSGRAMIEAGAANSPVICILDSLRQIISRYPAEGFRLPFVGEIMQWVNFLAHPQKASRPLWPAKEAT